MTENAQDSTRQGRRPAIWPVYLLVVPGLVSAWSGWSVVAVRAGLGPAAVTVPASVVLLVWFASQAYLRTSSRLVRVVWFGSVVCAGLGAGLGSVLDAGPGGGLLPVRVLVWLVPVAGLAGGCHLVSSSRKVV